jgi:hypothetical protein
MLRTANCGGRRMTSENDFEQSSAQRTVNSYGKMKFPPRTVTVIPSIGFLLDPDNGRGGGGALREVRFPVRQGEHPYEPSTDVKNEWSLSSTPS